MNAVLNFEFPSVDKGEAGAADLSAGSKRARDVAVMASARRPVEDFGSFIFATVSLSCSTEAMVDTSSAYPKFSSPQADGQQALSFAGRSPFQDNPDALLHLALMLLICLAGNKGIAVNRCNCCGGQLWWIDRVGPTLGDVS